MQPRFFLDLFDTWVPWEIKLQKGESIPRGKYIICWPIVGVFFETRSIFVRFVFCCFRKNYVSRFPYFCKLSGSPGDVSLLHFWLFHILLAAGGTFDFDRQ